MRRSILLHVPTSHDDKADVMARCTRMILAELDDQSKEL